MIDLELIGKCIIIAIVGGALIGLILLMILNAFSTCGKAADKIPRALREMFEYEPGRDVL